METSVKDLGPRTRSVPGLSGHWHTDMELPCGYQHFNWYRRGYAPAGQVYLDDPDSLRVALRGDGQDVYLYTHHQVFLDGGIFKHTRSSPNWEGGVVTYATCKHLMRSTSRTWEGVWLAGLCPKDCAANAVLFVGRVWRVFRSNYHLGLWLRQNAPAAWEAKQASRNPRGDLYAPLWKLLRPPMDVRAIPGPNDPGVAGNPQDVYDHRCYEEPPGHTRSVEFYSKSPGSVGPPELGGKVPKWWRDLEYQTRGGLRPPCFILAPCWLFSRPALWSARLPGRAALKLNARTLAGLLGSRP